MVVMVLWWCYGGDGGMVVMVLWLCYRSDGV